MITVGAKVAVMSNGLEEYGSLVPGLLWAIFIVVCMSVTTSCVPDDLVMNGGFDSQLLFYPDNETVMSIGRKSKNKVPYWKISNGSIQVVNSRYFYPDSSTWNGVGNYCVHLNTKEGPGTIYSAPLLGQIAGAVYNLSINLAGSPEGGELYKKMQITVLFKRRFSWLFSEQKYAQYNASNPYTSRSNIFWTTKMYAYIGTGRETRIKIASKSGGSTGFFIDNVHVSLHNILDNGSFEQLSNDNMDVFPDADIVSSPSWKIRNWYLESGSVKYIRGRLHPSTDHSGTALDMNGDAPGLLSCNVSTINKEYYYVSFDHAANPEAGKLVKGYFSLTVYKASEKKSSIKKKWVWVTNKGSTKSLVGWKSTTVGFYAKSDVTYIKFESKIKGAFGPLLDNVQMYQYTTSISASTPTGVLTYPQLTSLLGASLLLHILRG